MPNPSGARAGGDHFEVLYRDRYQAIFAYVARRIEGDAETVADLTAEVFVVALRKRDAIPPAPEDRLWLYGVPGGWCLTIGSGIGARLGMCSAGWPDRRGQRRRSNACSTM